MCNFADVFLKYLKSLQIVQALRIFPLKILLLSLIPQKDNSSYRLYMTRRAYRDKLVRVIRRQRATSLKIFKKRQMCNFADVFFLKYLKSLQIVQALRIFPLNILLLSLIPQKEGSSYRLYMDNKLRTFFFFQSFWGHV